MTLGMLKSKIEKEYSIPKEFQRWILNKRLVIDDDITLSDYDVTDAGCPLFLYLMYPSSESEESNVLNNNSSSNEENQHQNLFFEEVQSHFENIPNIPEENEDVCSTCGILESCHSCRESKSNTKAENSHCRNLNVMAENHEVNEEYENLKKEAEKNYQFLIQLDNQDLIPNADSFECSVCFSDVKANEGVVLRDCLHQFCKQCLANAIEFTENAIIKCLFRNDQYSCDSILQEREIKALVSPEVFERYLRRGLVTAESCTENSFHCKSPDCPGWCVYEDTINTFDCPVCFHVNCLSCQAIHEGLNCKQYQDELAYRSERDKEARETKEYLENMVKEGKAMFCPKCNVIVMKRWGCDWLKCSVCQTEICWITKQPRWGPELLLT
ncbi:ranBP-type and C3HC4-type zinc finger-containing protein 1-like isoform X3 [Centruroides vittatus]|uniref:ranBP-type and C3HC4-type zinc finger-containing protein 1-like isoform X3 n=1 Tax=Centruroides vittatus TaxID=120091 RepID=UPI00350EBF81